MDPQRQLSGAHLMPAPNASPPQGAAPREESMPTTTVFGRQEETRGHATSFAANAPTRAPHLDGYTAGLVALFTSRRSDSPVAPSTHTVGPTHRGQLGVLFLEQPGRVLLHEMSRTRDLVGSAPKGTTQKGRGRLPHQPRELGPFLQPRWSTGSLALTPRQPFCQRLQEDSDEPPWWGPQNRRLFSDGQDTNGELQVLG